MTKLTFDEAVIEISFGGSSYTASSGEGEARLEVLEAADGRLLLSLDGQQAVAYVSADGATRWVTLDGRTYRLTRKSPASRSAAEHDGASELAAPMPGQVRAVNVQPGGQVTKGQVLVVLEAMKMEIRLQAPFDGQVDAVNASVGQTVEREQVLVRLKRSPRADRSS